MTRSKLASVSIAAAVVFGVVVPLLAVTTGSVAANHAGNQDVRSYHAEQDDRCITLSPLGDGQRNVTELYDYRPTYSDNYSSHGTTDIQRSQTSQLFVYHGVDGVSLVALHDSIASDGQGGAITMAFTDLPADGRWVVEDDDYGNGTDDNFDHGTTTSDIDWMWGPGRTDGGVFRGLGALGPGDAVHVEPAFGEQSYAYADRAAAWPYATNETSWRARNGEGDLVPLDERDGVAVGPGACSPSAPLANLTATPDPARSGESVTLDASLSYDEGSIDEYRWDVDGDGDAETETDEPTLSHTYEDAGAHEATVTVVDDDGNRESSSYRVEVVSEHLNASIGSSADFTVERETYAWFNSTSTAAGDVAGCEWTFEYGPTVERRSGDGLDWGPGSTECAKRFAFTVPGTYNVTLTVTDEDGDTDATTRRVEVVPALPVDESHPKPTARLSGPDEVEWGATYRLDASNSTAEDGVYHYYFEGNPDSWYSDERHLWDTTEFATYYDGQYETIDVAIGVRSVNNRTDWAWETIEILDVEKPTANVSGPDLAAVGESVAFDASNSTDNGRIRSYEWTVTDNETGETVHDATGATSEFQFAEPGTYDVTVRVGDYVNVSRDGPTHYGVATETITVTEDGDPPDESPPPNEPPTVTASADPSNATAGENVTLSANATDPDGTVERVAWTFGDGATATGESVTHAYDGNGTYTATVTVTDDDGANATAEATVTVTDATDDAGPTASMTVNETTVTPGTPVSFDASGSTADREIASYEWDLDGDGTVDDTGATTTHAYDANGTYAVALTVTDAAGDADSVTTNVTVENATDGGGSGDGDQGDGDQSDGDQGDDPGGSDPGGDPGAPPGGSGGDDDDDDDDNDGGSSGDDGSGGSTTDDDTDGTQPTNATAERADDGSIRVAVRNATANETVGVSVPDDASGSVALRTVEFVPSSDADRLNLTLVPATDVDAPDGTDAGLYELAVRNGTGVESVTYRFAVDRDDLDESTTELRVLADDGDGWTPANHTTVENGSTTLLNATTDGADSLVLAAVRSADTPVDSPTEGAAVAMTDVSLARTRVAPGASVQVEATFENTGDSAGTAVANFTVAGHAVGAERATVAPGDAVTLRFEESFDEAGTHSVAVNGERRNVTVERSTTGGTETPPSDDGGWPTWLPVVGLGALVVLAVTISRRV